MPEHISLTIDGISVNVTKETTILEAARQAGVNIPTICVHEATTSNAICRTCVVEIEGARVLAASCVTQVSEGMVVRTRSERVERSRRTIIELLNSAVDLSETSEALQMIDEYLVDKNRFPMAKHRHIPVMDDNPMYLRDYSKCVLCWRCVQVCAEDAQFTYAINFSGRGFETQISTFFDKPLPESTCVFCGQCVAVCPSGALKPKRQWLLEQGISPDVINTETRPMKKSRRQTRLS